MKGKRFNKNKKRWRNVPLFLFEDIISVGEAGELKYDTYNFLDGLSVADTLDSLLRHYKDVDNPYESDYDTESKVHHLAHVAWNAVVALHMIKTRPDLDDRLIKRRINSVKRSKKSTSKRRN